MAKPTEKRVHKLSQYMDSSLCVGKPTTNKSAGLYSVALAGNRIGLGHDSPVSSKGGAV